MPNPAPVVRVFGTVHGAPLHRHVDALDAQPEQRDPVTGDVTQRAREARPGYDVTDVLVLTADGGFATILFRDEAVSDAGPLFQMPERGDDLDGLPCLMYVARQRGRDGWFSQPGLSFAGKVYAAEADERAGRGVRIAESA